MPKKWRPKRLAKQQNTRQDAVVFVHYEVCEPVNLNVLLKRQRNKCFYCGCEMNNKQNLTDTLLTEDHFFPKCLGYQTKGNIVFACRKCNNEKGDALPTDEEIKRYRALYQDYTFSS